jgi:hypothetical protein
LHEKAPWKTLFGYDRFGLEGRAGSKPLLLCPHPEEDLTVLLRMRLWVQ